MYFRIPSPTQRIRGRIFFQHLQSIRPTIEPPPRLATILLDIAKSYEREADGVFTRDEFTGLSK
jgi:hypothetical protein